MKHKVVAYITRAGASDLELLVFTHRDVPEAGLQVPAGTVEPGEDLEVALHREILEETGLRGAVLVRKLAAHVEPSWDQTRHVYQLQAPSDTPERWDHEVTGNGEDAGLVFRYRWEAIDPAPGLAGGQGQWLALLNPSHSAA
jgi:8-oxo-dGTP pyrophosphatase MutT (NUDIX family)